MKTNPILMKGTKGAPIQKNMHGSAFRAEENDKNWHDVTRRETIEGAEAAINGSIDHFSKKLEATKGPKVVKTFK
jgi:hypothetical protein